MASSDGLEGKRALITAGAGGIGLEIARRFAAAGARLAICDIDEDALARARAEFPGALVERTDMGSEAAIDALFDRLREGFGGLDILVNNAGIAGETGPIETLSVDAFRRCLDIDLVAQFICARHAVPMLKAAGGGAIINLSSAAGRYALPYRAPYAAAKWGVIGLTRCLARELGPYDIRVNAILPGVVAGPRIESVIAARAATEGVSVGAMTERYTGLASLGRMVTPQDVAEAAFWLAAPSGRNISGQSISVDGHLEGLG